METKEDSLTKFGEPVFSSNALAELLLEGKNINYASVVDSDDIDLYLKYKDQLLSKDVTLYRNLDIPLSEIDYHACKSEEWLMPISYSNIDVLAWLLDKCTRADEINRVQEEYKMFEERNLVMLLRFFIFLIGHLRAKKHIWGVGRGSSVSSYILFLIGIHKVDSIKYDLDPKEFLK